MNAEDVDFLWAGRKWSCQDKLSKLEIFLFQRIPESVFVFNEGNMAEVIKLN